MHERALMRDLLEEIERVARSERARRVLRVEVRLGALSHFTEDHFREPFEDASRGTVAENAIVVATVARDVSEPDAAGVVLESVEVER